MWSAITAYLGDTSTQAPQSPREQAPPTPSLTSPARSPRASLSRVMASSAEKAGSDSSDSFTGSARKVTILRGLVVGSPKSGKTSLLRRLRGEQLNHAENRRLMALLPWRMSEAVGSSVAVGDVGEDVSGENAHELVQLYLAEAPSFSFPCNNQIELNHQTIHNEWKAVLHRATRKSRVDFIVWIVDSRQNVEEVAQFVKVGLECLFPVRHDLIVDKNSVTGSEEQIQRQSRNVETSSDNRGDEADALQKPWQSKANENSDESSSPLVQNVCILLNFRDLQKNGNQHDGNQALSLLHQVREVAHTVITRHRHDNHQTSPATIISDKFKQSTHSPSVLIYESSMISNYGLQSLRSFITLPYLLHKEKECAERLMKVQRNYDRIKQELVLRNEMDSGGESYDAFIKKNCVTKNDENRRKGRVGHDRAPLTPTRAANQDKPPIPDPAIAVSDKKSNQTSAVSRTPSLQEGEAPSINAESRTHRQLFPSLQSSKVATTATSAWTPLDHSNGNNLDSFFSDEEESDIDVDESISDSVGQKNATRKEARGSSNNHVLDSDNDSISSQSDTDDGDGENSDDDFFIDSSGNRHTHASPSIKVKEAEERISIADKPHAVKVSLSAKADLKSVELEEKEEDGNSTPRDALEDDRLFMNKNVVDHIHVRDEDDGKSDLACDSNGRVPHIHDVKEGEDIEKKSLVDGDEVHNDVADTDHDGEEVNDKSVDKDDNISYSEPCVRAPKETHLETELIVADLASDADADDTNDARQELGFEEESIPGFDRKFSSPARSAGQESSVMMDDSITKSSESGAEHKEDNAMPTDKADKTFIAVTTEYNRSCQSQMVLDSDDESIGALTSKIGSKVDGHDDHEHEVQHPSHERELLPNHTNKPILEVKTTPSVSSAALAAIEAAKLEAERVLGESDSKSKDKKSKKESKKKSSKSKKSKRKEINS